MAGLTSVREVAALYIDHVDKPGDSPDCLLGVVPQPTDSRLSETRARWKVIKPLAWNKDGDTQCSVSMI